MSRTRTGRWDREAQHRILLGETAEARHKLAVAYGKYERVRSTATGRRRYSDAVPKIIPGGTDCDAAPLLHAPCSTRSPNGPETIDKVCRYLRTDPNCPCNYVVSQAAELVRFAFDAQPGETAKYTSFDMEGVWERRRGYREKARGSKVERE
jgi:hypothetical protein